jgi:hypothetical protein
MQLLLSDGIDSTSKCLFSLKNSIRELRPCSLKGD